MTLPPLPLVVSLYDFAMAEKIRVAHDPELPAVPAVSALPEEAVEFVEWKVDGPAPRERIDLVQLPYTSTADALKWTAGIGARLLQSQSIGYDGVADALPPGHVFANASSVHETSTAEMALALTLAAQRGIPDFVDDARAGRWQHRRLPALADKTVLLLGYGGVNQAVEARLAGFEIARVIRVARTARDAASGPVHAIEELPALFPQADVVVIGTPLTASTRGLVGAAELARLPDGALVVNVARGPVLDTAAVLAEASAGRLRFALDVTDPEPLPAGHPLFSAPGVLVAPHVGGATDAMAPRVVRLMRRQIDRMLAGEEPLNVVLRS